MSTAPNPSIIKAVEQLDYRVTPGDVAAKAGLDVNLAQQQLLTLASEAGGHLQVSETGEMAFQFSKDFQAILRNKYWRLRWKSWWEKVWRVLFYLIRISFGILLVLSIALILVAIVVILIALSASKDGEMGGGGDGGDGMSFPRVWLGPDWFWFLYWDPRDYDATHRRRSRSRNRGRSGQAEKGELNFFEAIFSFLFGDGDPNNRLEERRWQTIATVIRNNQGAIAAEQLAPYFDQISPGSLDYEDYVLPALARFDGQPQVSPEGQIIYHFPELQTTATEFQEQSVPGYLREKPWRFSQASSNQVMLSIGLGAVNLVGALVLGNLLADGTIAAQLGGFVEFVNWIYPVLLFYGTGFLGIPLVRYFWIQWRNTKVQARNQERLERTTVINHANPELQKKLSYAKQFATQTVIDQKQLAYTTEEDLIEQEVKQADRIDAEWEQRLNQSNSGS
ncbi:MAG: hypothetical protein ACFBSC_03425 [Microcoleaceae cyanobacterium]